MTIKIILILFILFAETKTVLRLRDKAITGKEFFLWTLLWALATAVVLVPDITSQAAAAVGVGRGADLVVYMALILLFYAQFRQMVRIDNMERNITKLARESALRSAEEKTISRSKE